MTLYKDNGDLDLPVVRTATGEYEYAVNCRQEKGLYFTIGKDFLQIEGRWYHSDDKNLLLDYETKERFHKDYTHKNRNHGIVSYNPTTKNLVLGYYTPNVLTNCAVIYKDDVREAIHYNIFDNTPYKEDLSTGIFSTKIRDEITNQVDRRDQNYNLEGAEMEGLLSSYNTVPYKVNKNHAKLASLLGDTTFGIELESCAGNLPAFMMYRHGIAVCKDGSVMDDGGHYAPEYVTVPLKGAKGITNVTEFCPCLQIRNKININCSYHLHIGGFNSTRLNLVALHSLCYKIQGDIFKMFPVYKLNPQGVKAKNYCKLLPRILKQYSSGQDFTSYINESYYSLYEYVSEGRDNQTFKPNKTYNRKTLAHPFKAKWDKLARYHWLNMVNVFFSKRNTIEFRLHTPTLNQDKIINWLLMCNAICKYAQKYPLKCIDKTKIKFTDVLQYYRTLNSASTYHSFVSDYLVAYYNERVAYFAANKKEGDKISNEELQNDYNYSFTYKDKNILNYENSSSSNRS